MIRIWLHPPGSPAACCWRPCARVDRQHARATRRAAGDDLAHAGAGARRPAPCRGASTDDEQGAIKLSDQQIAAAGIEVKPAEEGNLTRRRFVPGTIVPAGDRIGRVAVRLLGTVAELRKRLGDPVERNEVALIESREVADAKSEYLAIRVTDELQQTLFARATSLWQGKVVTENDYLRAAPARRTRGSSSRPRGRSCSPSG